MLGAQNWTVFAQTTPNELEWISLQLGVWAIGSRANVTYPQGYPQPVDISDVTVEKEGAV